MWAQLIQMRLKPGEDAAAMIEQIRAAEQPGSGLVRSCGPSRPHTHPSTQQRTPSAKEHP